MYYTLKDIQKKIDKLAEVDTLDKQIEDIENELKYLSEFSVFDENGKKILSKREVELKKLLEILYKKKLESNEETKKKLDLLKKDEDEKKIELEFEKMIFNYIDFYKKHKKIKIIFDALARSENSENIVKLIYQDYNNFSFLEVYDIYLKKLNEIKKIFIADITQENQKERYNKKRQSQKNKNFLVSCLGIFSLLKIADKKTRW